MTITVIGNDLYDARQKLGAGGVQTSSWLNIEPEAADYGRNPTGGFRVRWSKRDESFTKVVASQAELLKLVVPLISDYTKWFKGKEAMRIAEEKAKARAAVALAKTALAASKKMLKAVK